MAAKPSPEFSFRPLLRRQKPPIHCITSPTISRRTLFTATISLSTNSFLYPAAAFESLFVAPDQSTEEAEASVASDAKRILRLSSLVESRSWRELQLALREGAPLLKQDLYTIIQSRPRGLRPELRKLFSNLFNSVTRVRYVVIL